MRAAVFQVMKPCIQVRDANFSEDRAASIWNW
jgi:hypothetical protein